MGHFLCVEFLTYIFCFKSRAISLEWFLVYLRVCVCGFVYQFMCHFWTLGEPVILQFHVSIPPINPSNKTVIFLHSYHLICIEPKTNLLKKQKSNSANNSDFCRLNLNILSALLLLLFSVFKFNIKGDSDAK